MSFFWSGQHWFHSAALFLPVQEEGQWLVDMKSRIMTFHLQTVQILFYHTNACWRETAFALLRKVGGMELDKHLFLMQLQDEVSHGGMEGVYYITFSR